MEEELAEGCEAVRTNIPGSVWKVLVQEGEEVKEGQELMILESMKMEFPITSEFTGQAQKLYLSPGDQVSAGQLAVSIKVKEE